MGTCAKSPGRVASFSKIAIPQIRRVYPQLLADKLVGVQPLGPGAAPPPPQPASEDIIGAICLWFEETFPDLVKDAGIQVDTKTGVLRVEGEYSVHLTSEDIRVGPVVLFYEDPNLFDQLEVVVKILLEDGFDGLDCLLSTLASMEATESDPEDTSGSEGRIKVPDPIPQPASLIYYLRYRYASTKKGKNKGPPKQP